MKKIVLATTNQHKLKEVKSILDGYEILSLKDIGFSGEIEETGDTAEENSKIKAVAVADYCKNNNLDYAVIADDAGLFVDALDGAPGVHSARFASDHNDEANRQKLLKCLDGVGNRNAYFKCAICYVYKDEIHFFVGKTFGFITTEKIGSDIFGYDCLFHSKDLDKTFGEASEEEKNSVSHRGRAVLELKQWLDINK